MLRIMFFAFLGHMLLVMVLAEYLQKEEDPRPIDELYYAMAAVTVLEVIVTLFFRTKLDQTYTALTQNPEDKSALMERNRWHIFLFAFSESIVLMGFVLRFLATPLAYCVPFYVGGVLLLLLSAPRKLD